RTCISATGGKQGGFFEEITSGVHLHGMAGVPAGRNPHFRQKHGAINNGGEARQKQRGSAANTKDGTTAEARRRESEAARHALPAIFQPRPCALRAQVSRRKESDAPFPPPPRFPDSRHRQPVRYRRGCRRRWF